MTRLLFAASIAVFLQQAPPSTDIYLAEMKGGLESLKTAKPQPIAVEKGYDNQPSFTPDGRALVFTANRDGKQMDIYEHARSGATRQLVATPEGEYSPTITPDGALSVIRVEADGTPEYWAEEVLRRLRPVFDPKKPTALFLGRYQPFHDGHKALIVEGLNRVGQACIAIRNTQGIDDKNPFDFEYVRSRIEHGLRAYEGRFIVVPMPNITNIFYGRDVGYTVERIELDSSTENTSATEARQRLSRG